MSSFFDYPDQSPAAPAKVELLLGDATDDEWAVLLRHGRDRRFGPGDTVVTMGSREQSLYIVLEGQLEVLAPRGRRGYKRIALVEAGSVIGELSFFDGGVRSAHVRAATAAVLAELTPTEFDALAVARPDLARRLLFDLGRILAQRLRAAQRAPSTAGEN
ncbi:MAG TPA: cyclic nucleotide-binding domain-containing protein [Trebonia sp.]|nr:cyclic nucleotide-binding domain-containing protein [Trebonia sp.]